MDNLRVTSERPVSEQLRAAHRALAEAMVDAGASSALELARHWAVAGDPVAYAEVAWKAAREAEAGSRYELAAELLTHLLEVWDEPGVSAAIGRTRAELCVAASRALRLNGDTMAALSWSCEALEDLDADSHTRASAQVETAASLTERADPRAAAAVGLALDLVADLEDSDASARLVALAAGLTLNYPSSGRLSAARDAVRRAHRLGLSGVEARSRNTLGCLLAHVDPEAARAELAESGRIAAEHVSDDPTLLLRYYINSAHVHGVAGEFEAAATEALVGLAFAADNNLTRTSGPHLAASAAEGLIALGELRQASALLDAWRLRTFDGREKAWHRALAARIRVLEGSAPAARLELAEASSTEEPLPASAEAALLTARVELTALAAPASTPQVAARAVERLVTIAPEATLPLLVLARSAARRASSGAAQQDALDDAWAMLPPMHESVTGPWQSVWHALEPIDGSPESLLRWDDAVLRTSSGCPVAAHIDVLLLAAEAHVSARRLVRGRRLLALAEALVTRTGAVCYDARLARLLPLDGEHAVTPGEALTRREREVLRLLATGANNAEIASDLSLSTRTIEVHVGNILRKLGVRSRGAAVAEAMQAGYLGPDDLEPRSTT